MRSFVFFLVLYTGTICSKIVIENNAYKGMLIALPSNVEADERLKIVRNVEDMLRTSSVLLQMSTKGRAYFAEVSLLVPSDWNVPENDPLWKSAPFFNASSFSYPRAALTVHAADVVITEKGQYPYVLHQGGCGRRAMRIVLPKDFLLRHKEIGVEFARLWSEYRYGVFPEGGFENDERYPVKYRSSNGMKDTVTGCSDKTFWSSNLCHKDDKECASTSMTSSLMDQHLSSSGILFCEGYVSLGPRHNTESPSKHNLLCKEEGTWFTVMKSQDFVQGKNAPPKYAPHATEVSFKFAREAISPKVIVAIEISSRMTPERYIFTQAAFNHFVYSILPYDSEVTLYVFGDEEGARLVKEKVVLRSEISRILYVETQPLPEEPSDSANVSFSQLFDVIFSSDEDTNDASNASYTIIIVTTQSRISNSAYIEARQKISYSDSRLVVMQFPDDEKTGEVLLRDLCTESGGEFISLHADPLGNLYRGFGKSIGHFNEEIPIKQDYLSEDTEEDLEVSFVVDESIAENLKAYIFFPYFDRDHLQYRKTILQTPSGEVLNFMKLEFLSAWLVDLTKPEAGNYILKTKRVEDVTDPVLISVSGRKSATEDAVTVNVWAETLEGIEVIPRPIQIFAEVKKGWNPVKNAVVIATVHHPDGTKTSELTMLDDGLGDVDNTQHDGIYGHYFTNFTAPGFYNLHVKVSGGTNTTEVLKGPNGFCCGSVYSAVTIEAVENFQREAGPFTFLVPDFAGSVYGDRYPPSRITDLRLNSRYDRICVLHWTAVGDDYDAGYAQSYELKVFRDRAIVRNRFADSGQELYSETVESTPQAIYGTTLNHAFELSNHLERGVYYIAIRAIDDAGNPGEPSNTVPVWIEDRAPKKTVECSKNGDQICEPGECEAMPLAQKMQGDCAESVLFCFRTLFFSVLFPILSLKFSLSFLN